MKTSREILLKRHEAAEAKLNDIRENVVAEHFALKAGKGGQSRPVFSPTFMALKLWQELVWPCRQIWLGMAAVWMAILVFSLATAERETVIAGNAPPPTPDVVRVLKEQRQMMAQLLEPTASTPAAIRPRVPGPRSEQRQTTMTV